MTSATGTCRPSLRRLILGAIVAGLILPAGVLTSSVPAVAQTGGGHIYTVVLNTDEADTHVGDGVCSTVPIPAPPAPEPPADPATCTLRAAMREADADAAKDTIAFDLPGGSTTITLDNGYLRNQHHPVDIDGWTQPGMTSSASSIPPPLVRVDASQLPRYSCDSETGEPQDIGIGPNSQNVGYGFVLFGAGSRVRGLNISGFSCDDVVVWGASDVTLTGNYIGMNHAGSAADTFLASGNKEAVYVHHSPDVVIGGSSASDGNLMTAARGVAIFVLGGSHRATVRHNKIGVTAAGDGLASGVPSRAGIVVVGRQAGMAVPIDEALIADNQVAGLNEQTKRPRGVVVGGNVNHAVVERNLVGTDGNGNPMLVSGDPYQNLADAIVVIAAEIEASPEVLVRNNVVGGMRNGISLRGKGVHHAKVEGNTVGASKDRQVAAPNSGVGILVTQESHDNVIGYSRTESPDPACSPNSKCNVVAYNGVSGVAFETPPQYQPPTPDLAALAPNTIRGNSIYLNKAGGIDRKGYGVTPNDVSAGNTDVDFPVGVTRSIDSVGNTIVSGVARVPEAHLADLTIDVYRLEIVDQETDSGGVIRPGFIDANGQLAWPRNASTANPSSFGEGRTWVGRVPPDQIGGDGRWRLTVPGSVPPESAFTATITDKAGDTSEFSAFCADIDSNGTADNDGDALCDDWEAYGIDENGDGFNDLTLGSSAYGASPDRKDVYVEIDYTHEQVDDVPDIPQDSSFTPVVAAFASSGINLHLGPGNTGGAIDEEAAQSNSVTVPWNLLGRNNFSDLDEIRDGTPENPCDGHFGTFGDRNNSNCAAILGAKALVYRYALFGEKVASALDPNAAEWLGIAGVGDRELFIATGQLPASDVEAGGARKAEGGCTNLTTCEGFLHASVFMHELGHALGLQHGGFDKINFKPNHLSVMNYRYMWRSVVPKQALDYQRFTLPPLNESQLTESAGIGFQGFSTEVRNYVLDHYPLIAFSQPRGGLVPVHRDRAVGARDRLERQRSRRCEHPLRPEPHLVGGRQRVLRRPTRVAHRSE